ncbi:hypothetical protein AB0K51_20100 [Kitasatospora sp. NPDC049285]|uniref:hypothetical protein n=1 Tax=Kitasatospora sp. NPDC049285 TaxID=3157096 RepID=UPI00342CAEE4
MSGKAVRLALAVVLGLVTPLLGGVPAQADPAGAPTYRLLPGFGTDLTVPVMDALSDAVTINGTKVIASYGFGPTPVKTEADPACTFNNRPVNSKTGVQNMQYLQNVPPQDQCAQFARALFPGPQSTPDFGTPAVAYVPFAIDAETVALAPNSALPRNLSLALLRAIYTCDPSVIGDGPNYAIQPLLLPARLRLRRRQAHLRPGLRRGPGGRPVSGRCPGGGR